ncbi:hypothetical protein HMPREF1097_04286 [Enterocloster bolteae 90B8]|jgi:hypothetical protein|uniref:Uncharacterized protein n=1 Tax=Enterocloster bolteae 90B8 TaxID=997897 RepID=R0AQ29_9FIRM|nr:hypothetical protein HMPREF1097_04286 [Enterocloster bolteae 90B8]RGO77067.1 hypothetical protein DXB04_28795 [Enterocloster bolteae]
MWKKTYEKKIYIEIPLKKVSSNSLLNTFHLSFFHYLVNFSSVIQRSLGNWTSSLIRYIQGNIEFLDKTSQFMVSGTLTIDVPATKFVK